MAAQNMVGILRLVLSRRERAVLLEPRGKGIALWTLRFGDEVRDEDSYFESVGDATAEAQMLPLITQIIMKQTKYWSPSMVTDPTQGKLLDIINERRKAHKPTKKKAAEAEPTSGDVVDLMDVLRKSL